MYPYPQRARCWIATIAVAAGLATLSAPAAFAHDSVIGGTPDNDTVVAEFPDAITLEFSGQPKEGFNTVALSRVSDGEVLFTGEPEIDDRLVTIDVPDEVEDDAEPGEYRVGFQIISSDGHSTKGMTTFIYEPSSSDVSGEGGDTADTASDEASGSGLNAITVIGLIVAVIAVLGAAIVFMGRGQK